MVKQFGWTDVFYETEIIDFVAYLAAAKVMRQIASTTKPFVKAYPFAAFFAFLMAVMTPGVFMNLCLDEPILKTVTSSKTWLYSFISFGLCFFSPKDIFWDLISSKFGSIFIDLVRDAQRVIVAADVTNIIASRSGQFYFGPFVVASLQNCLTVQLLYVFEQLIRGDTIKKHELKNVSFSFRLSIFTALFCNLVRFFKAYPIEALTFNFLSELADTEMLIRFELLVATMRIAYYMGYDVLSPNISATLNFHSILECLNKKMDNVRRSSSAGSNNKSFNGTFNSSRNSSYENESLTSTPLPSAPAKKSSTKAGVRAVSTQKRTSTRAK